MYVYLDTYVYIYVYVFINIYIYLHIYICSHAYMYLSVCRMLTCAVTINRLPQSSVFSRDKIHQNQGSFDVFLSNSRGVLNCCTDGSSIDHLKSRTARELLQQLGVWTLCLWQIPLKMSHLRKSNSSVHIQFTPSSQFEFVPRDTEESEFPDSVEFGDTAFLVESVRGIVASSSWCWDISWC